MLCDGASCRKRASGGGYGIDHSGGAATLAVHGKGHLSVYHARGPAGDPSGVSPAERHFCTHCGPDHYLYASRWSELAHPLPSVIDIMLPTAPASDYHMMPYNPVWVKMLTEG